MMYDWAAFWTIVAFLAWGMACFWCGMQEVRIRLRMWCNAHASVEDGRYHDGHRDALQAVEDAVYNVRPHFYISKQGEI